MKALVYQGPWKMSLEDLPKPELKPGNVLIKMESVGICGSDVHGFTGESGRRTPGMVMGHEAVGKVVEKGSAVTSPEIGSRVIVYNILADVPPSPEEGDPSFLDKQVVGVNLGTCGAMADYLSIPAKNAIVVPDGLSPDVALLAEPMAVATHGFNRLKAKAVEPTTVAVLGAGTIGLSTLLVARKRGATQVVVLDKIQEKLERAPAFGAEPVWIKDEDTPGTVSDTVTSLLGSKPALVVDAVGTRESFGQAMNLVAEGGTVLLIGNLAKEVTLPLQTAISKETTLIGTYGFNQKAFEEALWMVPKKQDLLATFIEGRCSLEETPEVMTRLAKGEQRALKVVIEF
ncbi:MAG: alcohol dehydrogenase catalytic domain-containing protein [Verrucomicrobiae bacterium]|nr:alcohol dehydrogenase catalytic domain-containing protein [Verrucomicrobiae bacterium]